MKVIPMQSLKVKGAKALSIDEPNYLSINSKLKFVVITREEYEKIMQALEDAEDIRDAEIAMESGEFIPAEEAFKMINL